MANPAKAIGAEAKTAVLGVVERGGKVKAEVAHDLSGKGILKFIRDTVQPDGSVLITDLAGGHTNTIEEFFALLKRAWYGSHHHYQKLFTPLYVAEASWKYNHRKDANAFGSFIRGCFA